MVQKEKLIILGTTNYSFMIAEFIRKEGKAEVLAHTVDKKDIPKYESICKQRNVKLIAFEDIPSQYDLTEISVLNTVGYTKMNSVRDMVSRKCIAAGIKLANYISSNCTILSPVEGFGNIIFPNVYVGTGVVMGNNNVVYAGTILTHDIQLGDNNFIAAGSTVGGNVAIGNNCFLGMGCTIKNRISIADKTLVGAGTYVSASTACGNVLVPPRAVTLDRDSDSLTV